MPYAERVKCDWADEFFPGRSISSLPVCGKPIVEYQLEECRKSGIAEVTVLDRAYDPSLAARLGDGARWGLKLTYAGGEASRTFVPCEDDVVIRENVVGRRKIDSLAAYFAANLEILGDPGGLVLPGYSDKGGVREGMNVVVGPGVEIAEPALLGDRLRLERGVRISGGVVLGEDAVVSRGTRVSKSVVFGDAYVGPDLEIAGKIVAGRRVIDPATGAFVDLEDDCLLSGLAGGPAKPRPATAGELVGRRYTGLGNRADDVRIATVLADIAAEVAALALPKLKGVYLGGGYGRGEGGSPVYNDLDFFVLADNASEAEKDAIAAALDAVAANLVPQFGADFHIDFCRAKNRRDFRKDEDRIMVQEFLRGFVPVCGTAESLSFLRRLDAADLPVTEATRYLVNRGMGLLLVRQCAGGEFLKVNVNKAVLGAGDALLVAEGRYAWDLRERAKRLADPRYDRAVAFKFHPVGDVAGWDEAAQMWRDAVDRVLAVRGRDVRRRKLRHVLRWLGRRRTVGDLETFGMDALTRILLPMRRLMGEGRGGRPIPGELMRSWEVFN